jgi:alanine racemase
LVRQNEGWKQRVFVPNERPTWIELDLEAVAGNVERICQLALPADLMIVLKADAYGHGAVPIARTALLHGAKMAGVACLSEAVELRTAGIRAPILLLGQPPAWQAREIVRFGLSATVYSLEVAKHLSVAALGAGAPPVKVHVKVDTGMTRLGLARGELQGFVDALDGLPGVEVEGIFTHLATADEGPKSPFALLQIERFRGLVEKFRRSGRTFRYVHAANSAALINGLAPECDLVRVGLLAYGLNPSRSTPRPDGFAPAMAFKSRVAQVKSVDAGSCVSYGCAFITQRPSTIAVIPVGYGDGFRRSPGGWGEVLVRGQRAPVVGAVCMDMSMLDVTDIAGVKEGDEVVLIGRQGSEEITADDVAERLGTINYEVVTQILPRVPRTVP